MSSAKNNTNRYQRVISEIVAYLKQQNMEGSDWHINTIARHVYGESQRQKVDYRLILALMKVESNFKHDAVSSKGARGLLQIMPSLGKTVAEDMGMEWTGNSQLHETDKNIRIGVYHLSGLIEIFGSLSAALHAYNKGVTRAKKEVVRPSNGSPRFAKAVIKEYEKNIEILPKP